MNASVAGVLPLRENTPLGIVHHLSLGRSVTELRSLACGRGCDYRAGANPMCSTNAFLLMLLLEATAFSSEALVVLPSKFELNGGSARQQLIVENKSAVGLVGDVSAEATFESSDPNIVAMEKNVAVAVGKGNAIVTAR